MPVLITVKEREMPMEWNSWCNITKIVFLVGFHTLYLNQSAKFEGKNILLNMIPQPD